MARDETGAAPCERHPWCLPSADEVCGILSDDWVDPGHTCNADCERRRVEWDASRPDAPCPASVLVLDDRSGVRTDYCHLPAGHDGDHRSPRLACEPVAYLGWGAGDGTTDA